MSVAPLGLYVHVPFCQSKCAYCDFNSFAGLDYLFASYAEAISAEIAAAAQSREHPPVATIYIGGGTPTWLPSEYLGRILATCREVFMVHADAEITCEGNPSSVHRPLLADLHEAGVNRLSLGVQSFNDGELLFLRRVHTADMARKAFQEARGAGFHNIGLDLIFGLPGQSHGTWETTLEEAITLRPDHMSLYCLTVEEGTPLADWVADGRVLPADDDLAADLYLQACDLLASVGYEHYEISSWAFRNPSVDGADAIMRCRHNLATWRNRPFLGFGAGAHSSLDGRRWWNVRSPAEYVKRIGAGRSPVAGSEEIGEVLAMGETMMLGLRLVQEGVATADFESRFHRSPLDVFSEQIAALEEVGLLERLPGRVRLTERGRMLGNPVFARFLPS